MNFYTNSSDQPYISPSSSADGVPQPHFHLNANDPSMENCAQPPLSVGKLESNRKRKAEDEQEGRRVRGGAPPPSALAGIVDVDCMLRSARPRARDEEGRSPWRKDGEEYARAMRQSFGTSYDSSSRDIAVMPRTTGHWSSVKEERDSFEQENGKRMGATRASNQPQVFGSSFSPEMHSTPPRYSGYEAPRASLSPKMYGTPPNHGRYQPMPRVGHVKRNRSESENAEDGEVQKRSTRTQANADYMQEMNAVRTNPRHVQSEAMNAPSSKLPGLDATIPILSYSGLKLGQLLPCGEILGFVELPPLAQLYDLYSISLIKPQPEHAWIQQNWHIIQASTGLRAPTWQQDVWYEEINRSGTERKELAFRAIKTFRELGEKLWQTSIVELMEETLNLLQKEMDYTVLLLLVHRHEDDRIMWEQRLKVLFARLDPSMRPRNVLPRPSTPAPASTFDTQTHNFGVAPLLQTSNVQAVKEESLEHTAFFNLWTNPMGPPAQGIPAQGTLELKDEPMGMMW